MTNNEKQLQRVDMMNTPCPVVIAQCLFHYQKNVRTCIRSSSSSLLYITAEDVVFLQSALTFREPGRVVVDIAEGDVDGGGPSQSPQLAPHVLGLD